MNKSNLEQLDVPRDSRSRGWLYLLSTPGNKVLLVGQSASNLAQSHHLLCPFWPKLNPASLYYALHHASTYRQFCLACARIDSGEATQQLRSRIQGTQRGHRIFIISRCPAVYQGLWMDRPRNCRLSKRDVEMQVRLVDQSHNGSSVSTVSQASSRASVAVRKGDKHSSKKLHRQEAAEKQDDDDGSQLTVRCVGV